MSNSKLIELSYYDPSAQVRLSAYADIISLDIVSENSELHEQLLAA